jgi:hypothetical protein
MAEGVAEGAAIPDVPAPDGREFAPEAAAVPEPDAAAEAEDGAEAEDEVEEVVVDEPQDGDAYTDVAIDDDTVLDPDVEAEAEADATDAPPARGRRRRHG